MIVTLDQLKAHLRIQQDDEDQYLETLLAQSQVAAEEFCKTEFDDQAPMSVRLAVILMASFYYDYRDNADKQAYIAMRMAFENLLWPHRNVERLF